MSATRSTELRETAAADEVYVSAPTIWEAAIKVGLGRLHVEFDAIVAAIEESGFIVLPVRASHAVIVAILPANHRDPVDRLLVAQAMHGALGQTGYSAQSERPIRSKANVESARCRMLVPFDVER